MKWFHGQVWRQAPTCTYYIPVYKNKMAFFKVPLWMHVPLFIYVNIKLCISITHAHTIIYLHYACTHLHTHTHTQARGRLQRTKVALEMVWCLCTWPEWDLMLLSILWHSFEHTGDTHVRGSCTFAEGLWHEARRPSWYNYGERFYACILCFCHMEPVRQFFFKQKEVGEDETSDS